MKFIQSLVKRSESAAFFRNGYSTNVFHQKPVFASERLGVHRDPGFPVAHRLQHADHIPPVNMIAYGHHPIGKEFAVLADFLTAFNPKAIPDSVQGESGNPEGKVYEEMPYFELQGFIKIWVRAVEFDVLEFPADGRHPRERIVAGKFFCRFGDINPFFDFEIPVRRSK